MPLRSGADVDWLQSRCSLPVVGELDWSPRIHQQLSWRLSRAGQEDPITAFFLVSDEWSDPSIKDVSASRPTRLRKLSIPISACNAGTRICRISGGWSRSTSRRALPLGGHPVLNRRRAMSASRRLCSSSQKRFTACRTGRGGTLHQHSAHGRCGWFFSQLFPILRVARPAGP